MLFCSVPRYEVLSRVFLSRNKSSVCFPRRNNIYKTLNLCMKFTVIITSCLLSRSWMFRVFTFLLVVIRNIICSKMGTAVVSVVKISDAVEIKDVMYVYKQSWKGIMTIICASLCLVLYSCLLFTKRDNMKAEMRYCKIYCMFGFKYV